MDSAAIAGLVGAVIGGLATTTGSVVSSRLQASNEDIKWIRDRKAVAYDSAIRYFLRVSNRRSEMTAEGAPFIGKEQVAGLFDDLVEAQYALSVLTTVCGERQRERLVKTSNEFNTFVARFAAEGVRSLPLDKHKRGQLPLEAPFDVIVACEREESLYRT